MSQLVVGAIVASVVATPAFGYIRITEVMSASGTSGTADWIEVTNYGNSAVSMVGMRMDDNSYSFATSVALLGVTSLAAGESAIFFENTAPAAPIAAFKSYWSGLSGVQVGYYNGSGAGVSFSAGGDAAVIFNSTGSEISLRAAFGQATTGSSFYWGYNAATGAFDASYVGVNNAGLVSSVGTIGTQVTGLSSGTPTNTGSLGTAIGVPAPGAVALVGVAGLVGSRRRR
ncbi:MAG: lamin tail domain-containing protein [Planctomycetes bacterium]|nr:lamin tail domain-containing protein [Planctomycetota bacterium]